MSDSSSQKMEIHISTWSLLKIILFLAGVWFVIMIKETLAIVFVSLILASVLHPAVKFLREKWRFEANLAIITVYILFFSVFILSLVLLVPPMLEQGKQMIQRFPEYWQTFLNFLASYNLSVDQLPKDFGFLTDSVTSTAKSIVSAVSNIFGGVVSFFVVIAITYFLLLEKDATRRIVRYILPDTYIPVVVRIVNRIQEKIGQWIRAQIILCLIVGVFTYIGLLIIGMDYALLLAFIAGVMEFIPYVGFMLAIIPAIIIAVSKSWGMLLAVLIVYTLVQRGENMFLAPKIMQKAVGINPVVSIVALLIGAQIAGFVGVLLAIPVATAISVVVKELLEKQESD